MLKKRILSVFLALVLLAGLLPVGVSAAQSKEQEIMDTIAVTYYRSLRRAGKSTFLGFCGTAVSYQLYYLGIDSEAVGCDGKNQFNRYRNLEVTTGGYPVRAYSAREYTLKDALNTISDNGSRDVYNILVGFQQSLYSEAGRKFGHACVIYAIVDGTVYFTECCPVMVGDRYCPEGVGIQCSIDEFCEYYSSWTVLDGVVWFGDKTYAEQCRVYPAGIQGMVVKNTDLLSDVSGPEGYGEPEVYTTLHAGDMVEVTDIMQTPEGEYWYRLNVDGQEGYVPVSAVKKHRAGLGDMVVDVILPTYIRRGFGYIFPGSVTAVSGRLTDVEVALYQGDTPVFTARVEADSQRVSMTDSRIMDVLQWKNLPEGQYRLVIRAEEECSWVENGQMLSESVPQELWAAEIQVVRRSARLAKISFDSCGGDADTDQLPAVNGEGLGRLPQAVRDGHTFEGWYTEPVGGEKVTEDTVFTEDTTLYAHWSVGEPGYTGWVETDSGWQYHRDGAPVSGWFVYNGVRFRQNPNGSNPIGWVDGCYFSENGAVCTGWLKTDGGIYYLLSDGTPAVGSITIRGTRYTFKNDGRLTWVG